MKIVVLSRFNKINTYSYITDYLDSGNINIAIPTGKTPLEMYKTIVSDNKINWRRINIFMLDVNYPQDPKDKNSSYDYIKTNLLDHIDLPSQNFHILDSKTKNPFKECKDYEIAIKKFGGLDIAILGLGRNGHIAFNEPGTSPDSLTHLAKLTSETLNTNGNIPGIALGLTMGIKTILSAKKIILLAKGKEKSQAVFNAVKGPISSDCPASFLQKHKDVTFLLDKEAASQL